MMQMQMQQVTGEAHDLTSELQNCISARNEKAGSCTTVDPVEPAERVSDIVPQ
jgi:hypothetical protein